MSAKRQVHCFCKSNWFV